MDDVRKLILEALEERGLTMADASRRMGRNHAYLQQFIHRNVPDTLPEKVRAPLAEILGLSEAQLGAPARTGETALPSSMITIPEHDVRASAGPGTMVDGETEIARWPMPRSYIRDSLSLRSSQLAIIEVIGDSMEPTLRSGDKIMIDLNDRNVSQPGIFALYDGDVTVVKRVEKIPGTSNLRIRSDNPQHGVYDVPADVVLVAGRVVWFGRRI